MFSLTKYFFKQTLISFYKEKDKFIVQKKIIKNNKTLSTEIFEFEDDEFKKFITSSFIDNPQTYISTIIDTFNQGIVNSCNHSRYKELGINIDNIKILCIKTFSIFIGLYELNEFKKFMQNYKVDYLFSPYLLIHYNTTHQKNTLYLLITQSFACMIIYKDKKIQYSNISQFEDNDDTANINVQNESEDELDDIDDLVDDIDDIESLDDDLDSLDDINDIDDISDLDMMNSNSSDENISTQLENTKNELNTIEFVKNSIKDYYENYDADFLEKIEVIYNKDLSKNLIKSLEEETLLEINSTEIDILSAINELALKEINV